MRKYSLLFLMLVGATFASAQDEETSSERLGDAHASNFRNWSFGVNVGSNITYGDFRTYKDDTENNFDFNLGFGANLTYYTSSVFGIRGQFGYGNLTGQYNDDTEYFESDNYYDYSASAVINLSALALKAKQKDRNFALLAVAGLGMSNQKPVAFLDANDNGTVSQLPTWWDEDDNQRLNEVYVPLEIILKWGVSEAIDIDFGVNTKYYLSDKIDGWVSGKSNDVVVYPHVGVAYNFGAEDKPSVIYTNPLDDMYFDVADLKEDFETLTTDDDNDGVPNRFDKDNSTPEGVAVDGSGQALDVDGDGIPDNMDEDPFTSKGAKVDAQGREIDSDGDGVPDSRDKENNTPKGTMVNWQGQEVSGGVSDVFIPSVYFPFNSANISSANHYRMAAIARVLKSTDDGLELVGYADQRGSEEYNRNLAMRRAEAVKKQLVQVYGIDEGRISVTSEGESEPLADGRYDVNRRVDVKLK